MIKLKVTAIIALCLTLAALCSCGEKTPTVQTVTDVTAAVITEVPSIVPQTDVNGETLPYFALSALPKLEPYSPPQEIYSRFYEDFTDTLIPSDSYGELVPFRGKKLSYYLPEDMYGGIYEGTGDENLIYYEYESPLNGLATLDGKIVVDSVYNSIEREELDNGKAVYILHKNYDEGTVDYWDKVSVIASDGSWLIDGDYNTSAYQFTENRIIIGKVATDGVEVQGASNDYDVYDYNGKYLFSIEDVSYVDPYSEGFAVASAYPLDGSGSHAQFYDINGNKVFKEFTESVNGFSNGYARIYDYKNDTEYYIDTNGKTHAILPDSARTYFDDGDLWRIRCKENLLKAEGSCSNDDEVLFYTTDYNGIGYIFTLDGETVYKSSGFVELNNVTDSYFVIIARDNDGVERHKIIERATGKTVYTLDVEYNNAGYRSNSIYEYYGIDGLFDISVYDKENDTYTSSLYDCKEKRVITSELYNNLDIVRINDTFYFSKYEGDFSVLYDENDNIIMRINTNSTD